MNEPAMNLSPAFLRALLDAEHYHHDQPRKGTTIPYVSHLLGVCSIALESGATETEAIAALLHDAPEDAGGEPILKAIEANFGSEVAEIVRECSDSLTAKGEKKAPWPVRKKAYLEHLKTAGASAMLVSASDKLHNLRAISSDHREIGDEIWERFNAPTPRKEHILWYYGSLRDAYASDDSPRDPRRTRLVEALSDLLTQLGYRGDFQPSFVKP
jgi:(p)ppGpp synthase/HD superfamily hydrolase